MANDLRPVQDLLALLPDVAKVIAKFDFMEEQITVTLPGDEPSTYTRHSVLLIRPASTE